MLVFATKLSILV